MTIIYYLHYESCIHRNNCLITKLPDRGSDGDCHFEAKWMDIDIESFSRLLQDRFSNHDVIITSEDAYNGYQTYKIDILSCPCLENMGYELFTLENVEEYELPSNLHSLDFEYLHQKDEETLLVTVSNTVEILRMRAFQKAI